MAPINIIPQVHLTCGVMDPLEMKPSYRIEAGAEVMTNPAARKAFRNFQRQEIFSGPDDPNCAVEVMKPCRIGVCTPPDDLPEVLER